MIKAKKGLLITLFAAMMVFAFGATSAFAAQEVSYDADYSHVTITGSTDATQDGKYPTKRTFKNDGKIHVELDATGIAGIDNDTITASQTSFYDFNKAEFASAANAPVAVTYTKKDAWVAPEGFIFSAPAYVSNPTAAAVYVPLTDLNNTTQDWVGAIVLKQDGETVEVVADKGTEDTEVVVSLDVSYNSAATKKFRLVGSIAPKTATIKGAAKGTPPTSLDNNLYIDEVKDANVEASADISKAYDGKEHTVIAAPVKGYTVKYTVFNKKTGAWDAVDAVTYKDKADVVVARATYYDNAVTNDTGTEKPFSVTVTPSEKAPTIAFTTDAAAPTTFVKGQYDAWDYVVLENAAVDADKDALMAYFKAAYEIKETSKSNFDATAYEWKISAVTPAPKASDYAILKNYATPVASTTTRTVKISETAAIGPDYEVEFTNAPTSVTYKVKALKKKAKSFTVKAEANNGAAVTYKLINGNAKIKIDKKTGKITLKKGLKKGTYKIKVKAYVYNPAGEQFSETQAITIKVKK